MTEQEQQKLEQEFDVISEIISLIDGEIGKPILDRFHELGKRLFKLGFGGVVSGGNISYTPGAGGGGGAAVFIGGSVNHATINANGIGIFTHIAKNNGGGGISVSSSPSNVISNPITTNVTIVTSGTTYTLPSHAINGQQFTIINNTIQPLTVNAPTNVLYHAELL